MRKGFARDAIFISTNTAIGGIFGLAFWALASWTIDEPEVGLGSTVLSILGLISTIALLGIPETIIRHWGHRKFKPVFLRVSLVASSGTALLISLGLLGWLLIQKNQHLHSLILLLAASTALFGMTTTSIYNAALLSLGKSQLLVIASSFSGLAKLLCLWFFNGENATSIVLSLAVGTTTSTLITIFFVYFSLRKVRIKHRIENRTWREIQQFALSNWVSGTASLFPVSIAPFLLLERAGAAAAAYATIPLLLLTALNLPASAIARSAFVNGSRDTKNAARTLLFGGLAALLIGLATLTCVFVFGRLIYLAIAPEYAEQGLPLLRLFAIACIIAIPNYFIDAFFNIKHLNSSFMICNLGGTALQASALILFTKSPETLGFAWLYGQIAYLLLALTVLFFQWLWSKAKN